MTTTPAPRRPLDALKAAIAAPKPWHLLSGTALKWIALICMLVDHVGAILVWQCYLDLRSAFSPNASAVYDLYIWMRRIGRITFPLFCFVLVEGFVHTRSKPKYALRMLLFALVSEVPYDFALHGGVISYTSQLNVMFTLLLAFCALWLADELGKLVARVIALARRRGAEEIAQVQPIWWVTALLTVATVAGAAWLADGPIDVSYHAYGIILIGALYLARNHRVLQFALGCVATWWYCDEHGSMLQMWAAIGLGCIALYNGKRGRGMKYLFYVFYPLHLLVLGLLKLWLF